jgi:serine/threonine-protein kinase
MPTPRPFGVTEDQSATLVVPLPTDGTAAAAGGSVSAPVRTGVQPRRRRRGWIPLLAVVLAGVLVASVAWYLGAGRVVATPSVLNLTPAAATAKLTAAGLTLDSGQQDFSETVPAGKIIRTDPAPGAEIRQGGTVIAVVSQGQERYAVPPVARMSVADATASLSAHHLRVGGSTRAYDDSIAADLVVRTNPAVGVRLKRDQAVTLVVSKGPAPVAVPGLAGKTLTDAKAALTAAGLTVGPLTQAYSKTIPADSVISSSPKAGVTLARGSPVALVTSQGPPPVTVPDVVDKFEPDAKKILSGLGFKVRTVYPLIGTPIDRVLTQSAKAGTTLPWGSTITITVV